MVIAFDNLLLCCCFLITKNAIIKPIIGSKTAKTLTIGEIVETRKLFCNKSGFFKIKLAVSTPFGSLNTKSQYGILDVVLNMAFSKCILAVTGKMVSTVV